jgi:replicative DNA helicase
MNYPDNNYVANEFVVHNSGKTFKLLYSMHHAWHTQKKRTMFVSMEMNPLALIQRVAAMHTHTGMNAIKGANLSSKKLKHVVSELQALGSEQEPCWIVDGNLSATVEDIWALAVQLEPDAIWIDGAYLLKHPNARINKFERIGENIELIKQRIATDMGIPVVCSYQFNRDATKLKKNESVGLEHVAGNDAIGQISSIVLGLFEEESVETIQRRVVKLLKGRSGEIGEFAINWDFKTMDFSQYVEPTLADLNHL